MKYLLYTLLLTPTLVLAEGPKDFKGLVGIILDIIDVLVVFVFALTFIVLIWGIIKAWIINGGDKTEIDKGKKVISVGIIVLVIMSGIWGILELLTSSLFGI